VTVASLEGVNRHPENGVDHHHADIQIGEGELEDIPASRSQSETRTPTSPLASLLPLGSLLSSADSSSRRS
jgi:hypothetical protein